MRRLGDTFRWKSENVSTTEVAEVLDRFPGVVEAIVYGVLVPGHDGRAGCAAVFVDPQMRQAFDVNGLLKHARANLPKYAVPVFLRLTSELAPMHNNKQNKVPLKKDGINVEQIEANSKDEMFWCPSALIHSRGASNDEGGYVKFTKPDLERLKASAGAPSPRI
jgi:acyl-coenzyme A synthetase/AMP-(fatty) acid ligase